MSYSCCLFCLLTELDTKGPVIYKLKKDYEASLEVIQQLKQRRNVLVSECEGLRAELDDTVAQMKGKQQEVEKYKQMAKDRGKQVSSK